MTRDLGNMLVELRSWIDKSAEERLSDGNVLSGNRRATDGAGESTPPPKATSPDLEHPQIEQTGDKDKQNKFNIAQQGNEKSTKATSLSQSPPSQKVAALANELLSKLDTFTSNKSAAHTAGSEAAENIIKSILSKSAAEDDSEEESKSESMKEEERAAEGEESPAEEYPANDEEEIEIEKLSSDQQAKYYRYKEAGAQACREFIAAVQQQQGPALQKQAAEAEAAGREFAKVVEQARLEGYKQAQAEVAQAIDMQKRAAEAAEQQKMFIQKSVEDALNNSVKQAEAQIAAQDRQKEQDNIAKIAAWLNDLQGNGGTPRPFVSKAAAHIDQVHPILSGLLGEGTIDDTEKQKVLDYIAAAEALNEKTIAEAVKEINNPEVVAERLSRTILQHNAHPAPSPDPAMPVSQVSPSAQEAVYTGTVSQHPIPGSLEEREGDESSIEVQAAAKKVLQEALASLKGGA